MKCDKFKCVYEIDGQCEADGGECIGDMCEYFGESVPTARIAIRTSATD